MTRHPVAIIGAVQIAIIAIIGVLAAAFGWGDALEDAVEGAAVAVLAAISAVIVAIGAWQAQRRVTPTADPRLPIGTTVNATDPNEPTGTVTEQ